MTLLMRDRENFEKGVEIGQEKGIEIGQEKGADQVWGSLTKLLSEKKNVTVILIAPQKTRNTVRTFSKNIKYQRPTKPRTQSIYAPGFVRPVNMYCNLDAHF